MNFVLIQIRNWVSMSKWYLRDKLDGEQSASKNSLYFEIPTVAGPILKWSSLTNDFTLALLSNHNVNVRSSLEGLTEVATSSVKAWENFSFSLLIIKLNANLTISTLWWVGQCRLIKPSDFRCTFLFRYRWLWVYKWQGRSEGRWSAWSSRNYRWHESVVGLDTSWVADCSLLPFDIFAGRVCWNSFDHHFCCSLAVGGLIRDPLLLISCIPYKEMNGLRANGWD